MSCKISKLRQFFENGDNKNRFLQEWNRPAAPLSTPNTNKLCFQQMDIDYYIGYSVRKKECGGYNMQQQQQQQVPIIRLFGLNDIGNTICCNVFGFFPYIYVSVNLLDSQKQVSYSDQIKGALNRKIYLNETKDQIKLKEYVLSVDRVCKQSIYGYQEKKSSSSLCFFKVTVALPKLISIAKIILENGLVIDKHSTHFRVYESNVDFTLRFMTDAQMPGCCWIELPIGEWEIKNNETNFKNTTCQLEVNVFEWEKIIIYEPEGEWGSIAPLRILSFDIECGGRRGIFPEPEIDPVIQIGNVVTRHGETEPFISVVFTLNSCAPIVGSKIFSFQEEKEMLENWSKFLLFIDPDIITGYNINNFDLPYLLNRAKHLNLPVFAHLGRVKGIKSTILDTITQNKQTGKRNNKIINIDGRCLMDLLTIILKEHKLRSYTLNSVSYHFLNEQKEDVHHSIISELQNGNDQTRKRLAEYCLKDSILPLKLLNKLMCVVNYIEMARVTGIPLSYVINRGQQIKIFSQILRKAKEQNLVLPVFDKKESFEYEGATVIEPKRGYYNVPIVTLDFVSLYPSIMIAHNLCYTTFIDKRYINQMALKTDDYIITPSNNYFVKCHKRKGLIPEILESFLIARKKAKIALKNEEDPWKKKVFDGRQLAYKILANSVYGFTGAQIGKLPCLDISQSVTAFGRTMISLTKNKIEEKYNIAIVIYGDTDSVMINFGVETLEEDINLGKEAANHVTQSFIKPINLDFEKIYFLYLLINKKRYAGLYYTNANTYDKIDCKGLETIRRDNCPLVAKVINTCLKKILIDRNPIEALNFVKQTISKLLCNEIDISQLVITKELTKKAEEYKGKQIHNELAIKLRKRDAGSAPKLGDRIPYVIICGFKKSPIYERAEDPIYVLENNIPLDYDYYLKHQLSKPLIRIFEPILGDKTESYILIGEHTQKKSLPISRVGPLGKFFQIHPTCINCKIPLLKRKIVPDDVEYNALCNNCKVHETDLYTHHIEKLATLEKKFNQFWTECQRCQGSLIKEIICSNRDCPIFYMRKKTEIDFFGQKKIIDRFGLPQ
ncbi:DNA polymerase delta catalytic subunit-like [Palaemon carinicauda]|uniref:DNA polymerase delta catalytic subunit-like n=1 Tax=Palaemon carinicauda TaxID=392227 RepID=UPI0035B5F20E